MLKVIFENDYLQEAHIIRLCEICTEHGVAFVKTSTGYGFVKQPSGDYNYRGAPTPSWPSCGSTAVRRFRSRQPAACVPSMTSCACGRSASPGRRHRHRGMLAEAVKRGLPGPMPAGLSAKC